MCRRQLDESAVGAEKSVFGRKYTSFEQLC